MQKILMICDRCGYEVVNEEAYWALRIRPIVVRCPPDGIYGGEFAKELCAQCRTTLHDIVYKFLSERGV